ncbi:hypothetical protein SAMN06295900_101530 [Trinickia caryophylli]|uniref:Uncharacterized protein n=1 Tax=Trinickia caryophylli TaxID=28094 RepID=A0A1X7CKL4_TRICW|nr:hypothetical protein SAMN06295900_101530 [Trinickia caryophylli]
MAGVAICKRRLTVHYKWPRRAAEEAVRHAAPKMWGNETAQK